MLGQEKSAQQFSAKYKGAGYQSQIIYLTSYSDWLPYSAKHKQLYEFAPSERLLAGSHRFHVLMILLPRKANL